MEFLKKKVGEVLSCMHTHKCNRNVLSVLHIQMHRILKRCAFKDRILVNTINFIHEGSQVKLTLFLNWEYTLMKKTVTSSTVWCYGLDLCQDIRFMSNCLFNIRTNVNTIKGNKQIAL